MYQRQNQPIVLRVAYLLPYPVPIILSNVLNSKYGTSLDETPIRPGERNPSASRPTSSDERASADQAVDHHPYEAITSSSG